MWEPCWHYWEDYSDKPPRSSPRDDVRVACLRCRREGLPNGIGADRTKGKAPVMDMRAVYAKTAPKRSASEIALACVFYPVLLVLWVIWCVALFWAFTGGF